MIKVTAQDLLEFVKSQDPDKIIDMDNNYYKTECGCLMVQYGKEKFPDVEFDACGSSGWFPVDTNGTLAEIFHRSVPTSIFSIIPSYCSKITFAEAQEYIEDFLLKNPEN
jgi:hypothetical protein